jgi:bifunctional oligoribonuclease and PAP phosphatase NrnA
MSTVFELLATVADPNIVITTHHKPDGDALGSSLGLLQVLKNCGFDKVVVISPTDYPDFFSWMPGSDSILIYENDTVQCEDRIRQADVIFCLDFNKYSRINEMGAIVSAVSARKILIDHHQEPDTFDHMTWWDSGASSTCELVFNMLNSEGKGDVIDQRAAQCLYTGIMTDTGSFRYSSTNSNTHKVVSSLLETGIQQHEIHSAVFDSFSENRIRLLGFVLTERLDILHDYKTVIIHLSREDLKRFDVKTGDTEGLVNYGLSIQGIKLAILIIDRTVMIKMSFRSKGAFDVHQFAMNHFNGGGHIQASGGSSSLTLSETIEKCKALLMEYQQDIIK